MTAIQDTSRLLKYVINGMSLSRKEQDAYWRLVACLKGLTVDDIEDAIGLWKDSP